MTKRDTTARKVLLGLVVLAFLGWLATARRPDAPRLDADCAKAAFTLSATTVERGKPVTFRIVGVEGREYALGLDTATFRRTGARWEAVPQPGREDSMLVPATPRALGADCARTGLFGTPVPPGTHTVTLYELGAAPVVVAEQRLEVTEP